MAIDFAQLARSKSDEELQAMIAAGEDEWAPGALAAARAELAKRGVDVREPEPAAERPAGMSRPNIAALLGMIFGGVCIVLGLMVAATGGVSIGSIAPTFTGMALFLYFSRGRRG